MKVETRPSYNLNIKELSLREFKMYAFCSEYFREYFDKKDIPLKETRSDSFLIYLTCLKQMLSHYKTNKSWPNDITLLHTFGAINNTALSQGFGVYWPNKKNDFYLSLINARADLIKANRTGTSYLKDSSVVLKGLRVNFQFLLTTNNAEYIIVDTADPLHYIDIWIARISTSKKLRVIYFNSNDFSYQINEFNLITSAKVDVKNRLDSISSGIQNDCYIPIFNCKHTCPHSNLCGRIGEWEIPAPLHRAIT